MAGRKQEEIGSLKVGRFIILDNQACRISDMQKSAPGKHGHAKYRVSAIDLITGQKKVIVITGHAKVDVPIIDKKPAQVLSVSGSNAQIMDLETYETFDAEIDDEVKGKVIENAEVTYWDILGRKIIKQVKG